jgi:methylmalonyl-CoA mutase cobalamin-binding domain/chain
LWQPIEAVVRTVADEDAEFLGISLLSGAHLTLAPRLLEALRQEGLDHVGVILGGIIPEADVPKLQEMGIQRVFGPGASIPEIADYLRASAEAHGGARP